LCPLGAGIVNEFASLFVLFLTNVETLFRIKMNIID